MPEVTEVVEETVVTPEQELAAFNEGFSDTVTPPTEKPAPTEEEKPAEEAPVEEVPAPKIKTITEEEFNQLQESAAQVASMKATLEKQFGTAFGKIGGIERVIQQIQASTPTGQVPEISEADLEELGEYGSDMPAAMVKGLNRALSKMKGTGPAIDENRIQSLVEERLAPELTKLEQKLETKAVARAHPDYKEVFADAGFAEWRNALPEDRRAELDTSWDSDVITKAISEYKESKKPKETPKAEPKAEAKTNSRKEVLEASVAPRGAPAAVKGKKTEEEEFMEGFNSK